MILQHGCIREYMGFVKISAQHPDRLPQNLCEGWWVGQEGPGTGAARAPSDSTVEPRASQLCTSNLRLSLEMHNILLSQAWGRGRDSVPLPGSGQCPCCAGWGSPGGGGGGGLSGRCRSTAFILAFTGEQCELNEVDDFSLQTCIF